MQQADQVSRDDFALIRIIDKMVGNEATKKEKIAHWRR